MNTIKKLFSGKEITITISTVPDETTYRSMNPSNKKHLMESIAEEPSIRFTPGEFNETVSKDEVLKTKLTGRAQNSENDIRVGKVFTRSEIELRTNNIK
ncbi:MAG: hypothetical protein GZ094_24175 [Mariniphaga sp.]|nr:hypothetical protein [Mariniphaga sp.]